MFLIITHIFQGWQRISSTHLNIDAFVCLSDAGDGRGWGLARVQSGPGVVRRIQKALLRPLNVRRQTAQQICASSPTSCSSSIVSVPVSVRLSPHQAQTEPQTHLGAVQGSGHVSLLADARVCVWEAGQGGVIHRGGGLFVTIREGGGRVLWWNEEEIENKTCFCKCLFIYAKTAETNL